MLCFLLPPIFLHAKKARPETGRTQFVKMYRLTSICKAIAAINRAIFTGLERNLAGFSTFCADSVEHFTAAAIVTASGGLTGIAAGLATLRFIGKTFGSVKFLLAGGELEFSAAFFAN